MRYPSGRILIFAKAPRAGQVKTRLIPEFGVQAATRLHEEMLQATVRSVSNADLAPVQLWCAPDTHHPMFHTLRREHSVTLHTQDGIDLGARMAQAFTVALHDASFAIALGTDWPQLDLVTVAETCAALVDGDDAVMVPAEDGGYVLLGMRRYDGHVFEGIGWGGADVMQRTRERLATLQWRWREWPSSWDLDRPEDVRRAQAIGLFPWLPPGVQSNHDTECT
jgi:rSAM/selenodomain-associated transferase 1